MPIEYNGFLYRSKKHPVLQYIFDKYNPEHDSSIKIIPFTLQDITEGYNALRIDKPSSISNTILDLVRTDRGIQGRLPQSIIDLGYDLRKKTGSKSRGESWAGEFVFVGIGNRLSMWLEWPEPNRIVSIDSSKIPQDVLALIKNDEGALFSVMDYCDVLSQAIAGEPNTILRVQHPIKLQPNEIDGLYFRNFDGVLTLFPVEAKALSTRDPHNLDQLRGGIQVLSEQYGGIVRTIIPLAAKMIPNGIMIGVLEPLGIGQIDYNPILTEVIQVVFTPPILRWQ